MSKVSLEVFKKGIDAYKKKFPKNYTFLDKEINIERYILSIAKIESNFDYKVVSKDGYNTKGLFQFLTSVLDSTILSYASKSKLNFIKKLYYSNPVSQVFVALQLTFLNLKMLEKKGKKLNKDYQFVIQGLFIDTKDHRLARECQLAILHNQGSSSFSRMARNYNPLVFYLPNYVGIATSKVFKNHNNINWLPLVLLGKDFVILAGASILTLAYSQFQAHKTYKARTRALYKPIYQQTKPLFRDNLNKRWWRLFPIDKPIDKPVDKPVDKPTGENNKKDKEEEKNKNDKTSPMLPLAAAGLGKLGSLALWGLAIVVLMSTKKR